MIIYPAIDLKNGKCVRLHQGNMEKETIYNEDPLAQAQEFAATGFSWLHIVDLDGAIQGMPANASAVRKILKSVDLPVQLGGGIRNIGQVKAWLEAGVSRVILGTAAVTNPDFVKEACELYPDQIAISLDAHGNKVATAGWTETSEETVLGMAERYQDYGLAALIYTDISRDGTGKGLNIENTADLASRVKIPVIASGGVGSLDDVRAVREAEKDGVSGVIIGKALYDGRVNPIEALEIAS